MQITKNKWRIMFFVILGLAIVLFFLPGKKQHYQSKIMEFTAIDAKTGKPLKGVLAEAIWYVYTKQRYTNSTISNIANWIEAESDEQGHITIPAWGPITVDKGFIPINMPSIYFYKPGYAYIWNKGGYFTYFKSPRENIVIKVTSDPVFKLTPIHDIKDIMEDFAGLNFAFRFLRSFPRGCYWEKMPKMMKTYLDLTAEFDAKGLEYDFADTPLVAMAGPEYGCHSPQEFAKRYRSELDIKKSGITLPR